MDLNLLIYCFGAHLMVIMAYVWLHTEGVKPGEAQGTLCSARDQIRVSCLQGKCLNPWILRYFLFVCFVLGPHLVMLRG